MYVRVYKKVRACACRCSACTQKRSNKKRPSSEDLFLPVPKLWVRGLRDCPANRRIRLHRNNPCRRGYTVRRRKPAFYFLYYCSVSWCTLTFSPSNEGEFKLDDSFLFSRFHRNGFLWQEPFEKDSYKRFLICAF